MYKFDVDTDFTCILFRISFLVAGDIKKRCLNHTQKSNVKNGFFIACPRNRLFSMCSNQEFHIF